MSQNDESVDTFMDLGLTYLQAKVYLTLVRFGNAGGEVKKISNDSKIARQDIYRILPILQKHNMVVKIIANPTKYMATPLESGFSMLLQQKTEEYNELQKKAKTVFNNFILNNPKVEPQKETAQFIMTSGKTLLLKNLEKIVVQAQTNIDVICSTEGIRLMLFSSLPYLKKAVKGDVKIRIITDKAGKKILEKNQVSLKQVKASTFQLRYISGQIPVVMAIFDNKQASICVSSDEIVPSLWTNNNSVLKLAEIYFASMWVKSIAIETKNNALNRKVQLVTQ